MKENKQWTEEEKKDILDSYWSSGNAYCPTDDAQLEINDSGILGRKTALLYFRCPRCGVTFNSDEIEPEPKEIDNYNAEEVKDIVDTYFHLKRAICPRDGALLTVEYQPHSGGWFLHARCRRCGRLCDVSSDKDTK